MLTILIVLAYGTGGVDNILCPLKDGIAVACPCIVLQQNQHQINDLGKIYTCRSKDEILSERKFSTKIMQLTECL